MLTMLIPSMDPNDVAPNTDTGIDLYSRDHQLLVPCEIIHNIEDNQVCNATRQDSTLNHTDFDIYPDITNNNEKEINVKKLVLVDGLQKINLSDLQFLKIVGKGSFGVVYKALWTIPSIIVAVKKVETDSELSAFENETHQLSRVAHDNIIQMYGIALGPSVKCLVMEFADGGSLNEFLHAAPFSKYCLSHALSWLLQCAKAIAYLHALKPVPIVHRDLKPLNMLLINERKILKICDFGTATALKTEMTDNKGSTAWMAPEVMTGSRYSEKCDVYSWGMILWELLTRRIPFKEWGLPCRILWQVVNNVRPPPIQGCPKPIENLMHRCWLSESERPTMIEVIDIIYPILKLHNNGEELVSYSSSSESFTESCISPLNDVSSGGHTSQDVSEFPSSSNTQNQTSDSSIDSSLAKNQYSQSQDKESNYVPVPPSISPNVSASVVVGVEHLRPPWGSASSFDTPRPSASNSQESRFLVPLTLPSRLPPSPSDGRSMMTPLTIEIPHPGFAERNDLIMAVPLQDRHPYLESPLENNLGFRDRNVPYRQNLAVHPSEAAIRRKSAEVPQKSHLNKKTFSGHRRASSYESCELIGFEPLNREILSETMMDGSAEPLSNPVLGEIDSCLGGRATYTRPESHTGAHLSTVGVAPPPRSSCSSIRSGTLVPGRSMPGANSEVESQGLDLWQLLDDDLKPPMPLANNPNSQQIFEDHKALARKLLVVQEELVYLDQEKARLMQKHTEQDREQKACKQRYNDTIKHLEQENDQLNVTLSRLTQQRNDIERAHQHQSPPSPFYPQ